MVVTVPAPCRDVAEEVTARIAANQNGSWADPHNGGTYSLLDQRGDVVDAQRLTGKVYYNSAVQVLH